MSIKNKLVTAVTTAGLLAGLFGSAFVPAARADVGDSVAFECDTAASTSTCVQQVDGRITLTTDGAFDPTTTPASGDATAGETVYIKVTGADIVGVEAGTGAAQLFQYGGEALLTTEDWPTDVALNDQADADGLISFTADNAALLTDSGMTLERDTAGDATIRMYHYDSGVKVTIDEFTVTWAEVIDGDAVDFSNELTLVGLTDDVADCEDAGAAGGWFQDDDVDLEEISYPAIDNTDAFYICVQLYTNNDEALPGAQKTNVSIDVTDSTGYLNVGDDGSSFDMDADGDATSADVTDNLGANDDGAFAIYVESEDNDVEAFSGTLTVEITHEDDDLGIDVSETYTFDVIGTGTFVELTLSVDTLALDDAAAAADVISYTGVDAAGNDVAVDAAAAEADLIIDSDIADDDTIDAVGETDASAAFDNTGDAVVGTAGTIELDCTAGDNEAIEVTLEVTNADGDDITSNTVTVYCSEDVVDSMTITVDDATPAPGAQVEVTVEALDADGYPVPDAEVITFSAAQGAWTDTTIAHELGEAVGTYVAGQGGTVILIATGDAEVVTTSVMVGNEISLERSVSKLKGTADLGATYANVRVTFTIERISNGAVFTYYRKADASGVATFTLKKSGRFEVTASYGDSISNTVILKK